VARESPDLPFDPLAVLTEIRGRVLAIAEERVPNLSGLVDGAMSEPLEPFVLLPVCTGLACGGDIDQLAAVAAPVVATAVALRIIDDLGDDDNVYALHRRAGPGRAANVAAALPVASLEALRRLDALDEGRRARLADAYVDAFLTVCGGQEWDMADPPSSMFEYRRHVEAKTVAAFTYAGVAGALASTDDPDATDRARTCGMHIGWMTQILDDVETVWEGDGSVLLWERRGLLPVLIGLSLDHPGAAQLEEVMESGGDVASALPVLDEEGVRRYLISEALNRRDGAREALGPPMAADGLALLDLWLDWIIGSQPSLR